MRGTLTHNLKSVTDTRRNKVHYRGKTGWWWCSSGAVGLWGAGTAILVLLELFMRPFCVLARRRPPGHRIMPLVSGTLPDWHILQRECWSGGSSSWLPFQVSYQKAQKLGTEHRRANFNVGIFTWRRGHLGRSMPRSEYPWQAYAPLGTEWTRYWKRGGVAVQLHYSLYANSKKDSALY